MGMNVKKQNTIKIMAMVFMTLDHMGVLYASFLPVGITAMLRYTGRLSFPLFAFCIAMGAKYSRHRWKYMIRLFLFAFLSQPAFRLMVNGKNVMFTFALALTGIWLFEWLWTESRIGALMALGLCGGIAELIHGDYGAYGVGLVYCFYFFWENRSRLVAANTVLTVAALCIPPLHIGSTQLLSLLTLPILFYASDSEGFPQMQMNRWVFYSYYPLHIVALWAIKTFLL